MAAAPPPLWQHEVAARDGGSAAVAAGAATTAADAAAASVSALTTNLRMSDIWRHVKDVAGADAKRADLLDLLNGARREDTYQFPVPGWPSLLRAVSPAMPDLPAMVQEKYRSCQTMCFCGVFPEIRRAWASVDNSLFLWRYDRSGDVPVEYCGEEQAICCVGLARPKPGVFLAAIQHILVLATPVEIVILGVCISGGSGSSGASDGFEELSLQPMPLYTLPSDNVIMTGFAASAATGRLFLGGADGHVYELCYEATDSWRKRRCSKVRLTGGLQQMLPSILPSFLFTPPQPIERLVLDDERHILYSLASSNALQVFDLGPAGSDPARKVCDCSDYLAEVSRLPGRSVFGAGDDKRSTTIKHLAVIPMAESWRIHLMALTSNGRRAYFTTNPLVRPSMRSSSSGGGQDGARIPREFDPRYTRPATLTAVDARGPLPQAPAVTGRVALDPISRVLDVTAALYSHGSLLLAESAGPDGKATKLLLAARNYTLPPPSVNVSSVSNSPWLREVVSDLEQHIPGETTAIGCLPQASLLGPEVHPGGSWGAMQDELVAQMFSGPPQLVLVSTAGVLELERRRPVDVLQALLQERAPDKLQQFFEAYGAPEAAAMCYLIATAGNQSMALVGEAAAALENPQLVGQPLMPEEGLGGAAQRTGAAGGGIDMGTAVIPTLEPSYSGAHKGLALYISRLLAPVWDMRLITPSASSPGVWKARLSHATMAVLEGKLSALEAFLGQQAERRRVRGFRDDAGAALTGASMPTSMFGGGGGGQLEDGSARLNAAAGAAAAGLRGGGGLLGGRDVPFAKRQRLWNAAVLEEQGNNAIRQLAARAAQALFLLRTLTGANVNRLVHRLDEGSRRSLRDLAFRELMVEEAGAAQATQLVNAYLTDQLEGSGGGGAGGSAGAVGSVGELASALQAGAPSYFRDHDRQFFQATAKLKAAEEAGSSAERDALAKEALAGLLRVPECVNLATMVPRLAFLRQHQGIVELVLRAAALADPHSLAWRHGSTADTAAARAARDSCYLHMLAVLKPLLGVGPAPVVAAPVGAGPAAAPQASALTAPECAAAKEAMIEAILRSSDQYLLTVLFSTLVDVGADEDLLAHPSPALELYLRQEGGLGGQTAAGGAGGAAPLLLLGGQIGPLEARQVRHAELLARLYAQKKKYGAAAGIYRALAERRSGPAGSAVTLEQRLDGFRNALMQASILGDQQLKDGLRGSVQLLELQIAIAATLGQTLDALRAATRGAGGTSGHGGGDAGAAAAAAAAAARLLPAGITPERLASNVRALAASCLDISELYNSYAQPYCLWDVCLSLCDFAGQVPDDYVRQLWDLLLKDAWDEAAAAAGDGGGSAEEPDVVLGRCCDRAAALGARFYPNESSLPLAHVVLRLESIAAGLWPEPAEPALDTARVVCCLRDMLAPNAKGVVSSIISGLYSRLLSQRGPLLEEGLPGASVVLGGGGGDASGGRTRLRLGLLRSLAALCSIVLRDELAGSGGSDLGGGLGGGFPSDLMGAANQAAALADLAERYAGEARSLASTGPMAAAGRAVAEEFDRVAAQLASGGVGSSAAY